MAVDTRKDFLLATIGNHFGYTVSDGSVAHIPESNELNTFLDDGNCLLLAARLELTQGIKLVQVRKLVCNLVAWPVGGTVLKSC